MASNYWLYEQLSKKDWLAVDEHCHPILRVRYGDRSYAIYAPDSDEYVITIDVVQKVIQLEGDTISYPTSWCKASIEAIAYGRKHGVRVLPHASLFALLDFD